MLNKYNPRLVLTKEVEELAGMIAEQLGTKILSSRISTNVSLAEAPAHGISIMEYAPRSKATAEYRSLINEVTGVPMKNRRERTANVRSADPQRNSNSRKERILWQKNINQARQDR